MDFEISGGDFENWGSDFDILGVLGVWGKCAMLAFHLSLSFYFAG